MTNPFPSTRLSSHNQVADRSAGANSRLATLPGRRDLKALTGLRFLAAFAVVVYHFGRPLLTAWPQAARNIAASGFVAVSLFFLLSGFVLSYSYLSPDGQMRGTKRSFYSARFARIYPAYLLAFLLATPTNIVASLQANHLATAIAKLTVGGGLVLALQQSWTPWTAWSWNFPAWSVSVEAFFYLIFPFWGPRLYRLRPSACLPAAIGLWVVALAVPVGFYLITGLGGEPTRGDYLQMAFEFTPLLRVPEFLIGILLGRAFSQGWIPTPAVSAALSYLSATAIFVVLAFSPSIPHPILANGLMVPLFAILIYSLAEGKGLVAGLLSVPLVVLLGEASYGVYILQIPVSYVLHIPPPHNSPRVFAVFAVALMAAALVSWKFVEAPLRVRIRSWLQS